MSAPFTFQVHSASPKKFPLAPDRVCVTWLAVPPGRPETQTLVLRNELDADLEARIMVRESTEFRVSTAPIRNGGQAGGET